MKKILILALVSSAPLLFGFSNISTENAKVFEKESSQVVLSCIETQTLADGPGFEYLIGVNSDGEKAFVNSKPVRMRGSDETEWSVLAQSFSVKKVVGGPGFLVVQDTSEIDWTQSDMCYKLQKKASFYLVELENGSFKGTATQGGFVASDPSVNDCDYPSVSPPQPKEILCSLY